MTEKTTAAAQAEKETGRLETLSDGVIAIVITLLAIDIKVPQVSESGDLGKALLDQWAVYLAFFISFINIGIMWLNHHVIFGMVKRIDRRFLLLNGLLLMGMTLVPFTTLLVAEYIEHKDGHIAGMVYTGLFVLLAITFNLLWRYATHKRRLVGAEISDAQVKKVTEQYRFGPLLYVATFITAGAISIELSLVMCMGLAAFFALTGDIGIADKEYQG